MRKVTLGFKGDSNLKWEVKQEADDAGMTASEYLEMIVENRHVQEDVKSLRFRIRQAIQEKDNIHFKLEEYQNRLIPLYKRHKGQLLPFKNADGSMEKKTINSPIDLLDCILSSLKID